MEYAIKSLGKTCAGSGQPLKPGSRARSVLVDNGGEVVRLDYAHDYQGEFPAHIIGSWITLVPETTRKTSTQLDVEACFETFSQLCDQPNVVQQKMAYVIALLLLKKHRLILLDTKTHEAHELLVVEGSLGEGPFELRNLQLPDDEIATLQRQLIESDEFSVHASES